MSARALEVVAAVCEEIGCSKEAVLGERSRTKTVAEARQLSYLLIRELTRMSYPEIGAVFERDHSTVIVGVRRGARAVERDRSLRQAYERVRSAFAGPLRELEWINAEILRLRDRAYVITGYRPEPEAAE